MNVKHLLLRVRAFVARRRVELDLDEELAFHIERETQKHIAAGLSPADARVRARARFGPVPLAADQCRDARGTALVDTLAQDVRYALRTFRRAPLAALTIVATVALGLGLITVVFTVFDAFYLRADAVQRPSELFAVAQPTGPGAETAVKWTRREYEALQRETGVFTGVLAMLPGVETRADGRRVNGTFVSGNFFDVLGTRAALGRTLAASDDEPFGGRPVIVLSHGGWRRLFAGDPAAIGRSVRVNGTPYEIVGVMPQDFRGLSVNAPDLWAPLALAGDFRYGDGRRNRNGDVFLDYIVGRLAPGMSPEAATSALTAWASRNAEAGVLRTVGERPASVRLTPRQGAFSPDLLGGLKVFAPIFIAFGLILTIGCANVANLLLARGVTRQREIGVRLSLGAPRRRIIRQLLTESLLLALAAAAGGFFLSRLFLEGAFSLAIAATPPELAERIYFAAPSADWRVVVFIVAGAVLSTVVFGLMPALRITRLDLVQTMRGDLARHARPARVRHALIAFQVGASALLLICAAVFLRGAFAAAAVDFGLRTNDTVSIPAINEPRRAAILQAVSAHPSVAMMAAVSPGVGAVGGASVEVLPDNTADAPRRAPAGLQFVSPEYFNTLGIDVLKGRGFAPAERSPDAGVVVVSERFARRLWPDREAVGRVLRFQADPPGAPRSPARVYTIVGVVKTVASAIGPVMFNGADLYLPIGIDDPGLSLALRVHGDPDLARRALLERLADLDPAFDDIRTLRTATGMTTYVLRTASWMTVVLGVLALVLTLSGLFSVLSYLVAQRTKEIGVRMALGATARNVAGLVLRQSLTPVGVGVLVGGALAASLAAFLMSTPAASLLGGALVHVYDPIAYTASLLVIVTACVLAASIPAWRAARIDPIATLRQE